MSDTEEHPRYVTVTEGMRGFFAVLLHYVVMDDDYGFYEPWESGLGSYATPQEAADEARAWAANEEIGCNWYGPIQEAREED